MLKEEVRQYLSERANQAEEYTSELLECQEKIENTQREIETVLRDSPTSDLIADSKERQQWLTETTQMTVKRCHLEERALAEEGML